MCEGVRLLLIIIKMKKYVNIMKIRTYSTVGSSSFNTNLHFARSIIIDALDVKSGARRYRFFGALCVQYEYSVTIITGHIICDNLYKILEVCY